MSTLMQVLTTVGGVTREDAGRKLPRIFVCAKRKKTTSVMTHLESGCQRRSFSIIVTYSYNDIGRCSTVNVGDLARPHIQ
jgi:hypothetical protein